MRALARRTFRDKADGTVREAGELFDAAPSRVAELSALGIAEVLEADKPKPRKRAARSKE